MVAAEAAACGALPVVAGHSGMAEVARALAAAVPAEVRPWLTFEVGPDAVEQLADDLAAWLEAPDRACGRTPATAIVGVARERYSWDGVAPDGDRGRRGALEDLPHPAGDRPPPRQQVGCRAMNGGRVRTLARSRGARSSRSPAASSRTTATTS